jgi:uncharacterized RDD family membrane protein YckC
MEYEERTRIATPEGVELELVLAGLASRFMAELLDGLILGVLIAALVAAAALAGGGAGVLILVIALGGILLLAIAYHVAFEVLAGGRTPGKRWCGLRVVLEGGEPVGLRASAIRNLLRLIEGPPLLYAPAIVSVLATRRNQRLGDLAAGTLVIREPRRGGRAARPATAATAAGVAGWDVSAITAEDLAAIRSFLARRDDFTPASRRGLARELAGRLAPKVAGPRPGTSAEALLEGIAAAKSARS